RRNRIGPWPPVREDAAVVINVIDENVEGRRRDDEFDLAVAVGDARHAGRPAQIGHVARALTAFGLGGIVDRLVLRRERGLLVGGIKTKLAAERAPLAAQVGIF